jgi:anti-sigma-K factor RskA
VSRHPDDQLAAYAAGDLAAHERERLERHVLECAECRSTVADFRALLEELRATAPLTGPPADAVAWPRYRAEVRARLAERAGGRRRSWLRPMPVVASLAAAAAVAVLVWVAAPRPDPGDLTAMEYDGLAARLPLIDQYRVVETLDLLEDFDVIRNLDRLDDTREG